MPVSVSQYTHPNVYSQSIQQYSSYFRPQPGGSNGGYVQNSATYQTQQRPQRPGTIYNDVTRYSNSQFNRLPVYDATTKRPPFRPEFDDYEGVDGGDGEDNEESGEQPTNQVGTPSQQQGYHQSQFNCIPYAPYGSPFSGLANLFKPLKPFGFFRDADGGAQARSDTGRKLPADDPRTFFKLQYNAYNYGYPPPVYKPSSGYPCYPVQPYRPALAGPLGFFGQGGLFDFTGSRPGGVYGDPAVGNRPTPGQIFSDTVKPVFESTAIQDGIGQTVSSN